MKLEIVRISLLILIGLAWNKATGQTWKELLDKADSLSKAQKLDSAIFIGQLAWEKAKAQFGDSDTTVALVLERLGVYHHHSGHYNDADSLFKGALGIREKVMGKENSNVARILNNLGILSYDQNKYPTAESLYKISLDIYQKTLGHQSSDVAATLNNLANLYTAQAKYAEAESLYRRALFIFETVFGSEDPHLATSLMNLSMIYLEHGQYVQSESLFRRALVIHERSLGLTSIEVALDLSHLGGLNYYQGNYNEAESLFKRALAIEERVLGAEHPNVAGELNGLAVVYDQQGRFVKAEPLFRRSLAIVTKKLGPESRQVAAILNNLAKLCEEQGKYAEAETLYRHSLTIKEKSLGPEHPSVLSTLVNLAILFGDEGKYVEAETVLQRAIGICGKTLGTEHPYVASSLNALANLYSRQGKYAEAEPYYLQAMHMREKILGSWHPSVAYSLESLSRYHRIVGNNKKSLEEAGRAFKIRDKNFRDCSLVMSEKDALTYSQFMRNSANNYLSCYFDATLYERQVIKNTCDIIFSSKGQVSDGIFLRQKSLFTDADSATLNLAESYRLTKFKISQLFVKGPDIMNPKRYKTELDSLTAEAERLESELTHKSVSFRKLTDYGKVSTKRIASLLPHHSVLLEYLKYDHVEVKPDTSIPYYLVVVLDSSNQPVIINLGKASVIDEIVKEYRQHLDSVTNQGYLPVKKNTIDYKKIALRLYELIWKPVEKYVDSKALVFVSPDGGLNLISFGGIVDDNGSYLIESHAIHYLSAGRDLLRLQEKEQAISNGDFFALGDPDYNASPSLRVQQLGQKAESSLLSVNLNATPKVRSGCDWLRYIDVDSLPETKTELEHILNHLKGQSRQHFDLYLGVVASEETFKSKTSNHEFIHLATHGFFLQDKCEPTLMERALGLEENFRGENPLLLSGLLLAGSNLHGIGADNIVGAEDGILTAEEVAAMNLNGTRFVTLSACETGLGEVKQGEGVYGLTRAFLMAGARTVISTLWPIPDDPTVEMMGKLYEPRVESLPERIRDLQLEQIRKLRQQNRADHPFSWGAFIAVGDWRLKLPIWLVKSNISLLHRPVGLYHFLGLRTLDKIFAFTYLKIIYNRDELLSV